MAEPDAVERLDHLLGDVGDRLGGRPLAGQELVGAARELALGLGGGALELESASNWASRR